MNPVTIHAWFEPIASLGCRLFFALMALLNPTLLAIFKVIGMRPCADERRCQMVVFRPSGNLASTRCDRHLGARMDTSLTTGDDRSCSNHGALAGRPFCGGRISCRRPDPPVDNDSVQGLPPRRLELPSPHHNHIDTPQHGDRIMTLSSRCDQFGRPRCVTSFALGGLILFAAITASPSASWARSVWPPQARSVWPPFDTSAALILRTLEADGRVEAGSVSVQTIRRLLREHKLDRESLGERTHTKARLRWQAEAPNALWHGDVCHGPKICGGKKPLRIHALLDDASRYILAIEARHTELEQDMLEVWATALYRHGRPSALYLDNGATYRGQALRLACERLGTTLIHAKPYDAATRGKMERFWATLRAGCLDYISAEATLHDVNARLYAFLDVHYHQAPHAGLMGRTPAREWANGALDVGDTLDKKTLEAALTTHASRRVRKDSTVRIDGTWWQTEAGFLAGRTVTVARGLVGESKTPWLEYEDKRFELYPVDPVANSRRKRQPIDPNAPSKAQESTRFDPPSTLLDRALGRTSERSSTKKKRP